MSSVQDEIDRISKLKKEAERKTIWNSPLTVFVQFFESLIVGIGKTSVWIVQFHYLAFSFLILSALALFSAYHIPGNHQNFVRGVVRDLGIGGYWLVLGILSSVGLGTGLHTFVLYLGPFIAKVTMAAYTCGSIDFETHGENSFLCPATINPDYALSNTILGGLWQILLVVQFEALMWGIGTAIGELPPYFVARAARLAGQRSAEMEEVEQEMKENENTAKSKTAGISSLIAAIKVKMFSLLGNLGFFGILLFASIPNPLFDLAGITCGHFLVPFWTFFGATLIGKAFIKAHIQTIFVIVSCSDQVVKMGLELVNMVAPFLRVSIEDTIAKQKSTFLSKGHNHSPEKSWLSLAWDMVLITMIGYFLVSIVNSTAQNHMVQKYDIQLERLNASRGTQSSTKTQKKNK